MIVDIEQAFVLQSYETGNTSGIIRLFTAEHGSVSVMAKGLLGKGKEATRQTLQPGNLVRLTMSLRPGSDMGILREASTMDEFQPLRKSMSALSFGCLALDLAARGIDPGLQSEKAMELLIDYFLTESRHRLAAQKEADSKSRQLSNRDLALIVELLDLQGYLPAFAEDILKPWPSEKGRPELFMLDLEEGRIFLPDGGMNAMAWPVFTAPTSSLVPVPPSLLRFLYDFQRGKSAGVAESAERIQLVYSLCRLVEWHDDVRLPTFKFWCDVISPQKRQRP